MQAGAQAQWCIDHNIGRKPWASALRLISRNALASGSARLMIDAPNGAHFEPQRASVRAVKLGIACESGPHASALSSEITKNPALMLAH